MKSSELHWLKAPIPGLWVPEGLKDFEVGWFVNLLKASLRSEFMGYLILCEEGCSGCLACLWRLAGAHHPEYFSKRSSLVLGCFARAQIAGRRVLYFPPLVEMIQEQLKRLRNKRPFSEDSTGFHKESGFYSPLSFEFDVGSKKERKKENESEGAECEYCDNTGLKAGITRGSIKICHCEAGQRRKSCG